MTIETTKLNFNVSYGLRVTLAITTTRSNKPYPLPEYKEKEALVAENEIPTFLFIHIREECHPISLVV